MTRPPLLAIVGSAAAALAAFASFVVLGAERRSVERGYAVRTATSAAAYLVVVTAAPADRGDVAARLLVRARALAALPGWTPLVEVYLGSVPLVHDTAAPLDPQILSGRGPARWVDGGAIAPLGGSDGGASGPIGAVRVRASAVGGAGGGGGRGGDLAGLLAAVVLGVIAAASRRRFWLLAYVMVVVMVALTGAATARDIAARRTDRWLTETRLLLEDAGGRMSRMGEADAATALARVGAGGELSPGDSSAVEPRRERLGGREREVIGARVGPGRWLSLATDPGGAKIRGWSVLAFAVALLGPLGVVLSWWAATAVTHPREVGETVAAWGFLAPATVHLTAFSIAPLGLLAYAATHRWSPASVTHPFVGFDNLRAVTTDPSVWGSLWQTLLYTLHVPVATTLALGLALAAHRRPTTISRLLLAVPAAGSLVAAALVWTLLDRTAHWLDHPGTALLAVAVVSAWVQVGYQVPVFFAGLDRIPIHYHDAARVDGAGVWQHFRRVTFPLLRPVTLFALVTGTIVAAQGFTLVFMLTGFGPAGASDLIAYRIYRTAWVDGRLDLASALALLLAAFLLAATWMQFKMLDRRVEHA